MAKLKLQLSSSEVLGVYGCVDVSFNGVKIADNVELSASPSTLTYDVASISTGSDNTIKIDLINPQAHDSNGDGDFNGAEDQTLFVTVSAVEYSQDNSSYTAVIPQAQTTFTIPSGANQGNVIKLRSTVNECKVYTSNYLIKFTTSDGLKNSIALDNSQPFNPVIKVDGTNIIDADGTVYNFDSF